MARIKAVKVQACATLAEFEDAVDAAAKCSVQREKLVAHVMRTDFSWMRSAAVYHRLYALL